MAQSRSCMPPRREHLINEYYGASEAAFAAMEQVEYFSSHARMAKAKQDWPDEQDLWATASRTMLTSIRHRDYELKCRKKEYRLYKEYMCDFDKKVQKSIMAYCKRRLHRLRTWEVDNLRLKASIVHLDRKVHAEVKKMKALQAEKDAMMQEARLNGSRRAHVTSFGDGWENRNGGRARAHNEGFEMRQINYSIARSNNWYQKKNKERENAVKTWLRNKYASEVFQDQWKARDEEARRLMMIQEAQRDGRPIPIFDQKQASPLISARGDEDAQEWEADFGRTHGESAPHNLLSQTPTYEAAGGEAASIIGETVFQYAGMKLNDGHYHSGLDSGYESGINSGGEGSSTLAPAAEYIDDPKKSAGWDEPHERVSTEATWKAAWDAVPPEAPGSHTGIEEWEYNYAQEL